ncbi:MAG TPA: hypothetical protein ENN55_00955, partial [Firmicutes bacterium]|nr:hypothetical protein [Bacillota bacterium]
MNPRYNYTDMHLHSKFSWDARQTIDEIAARALEKGVLYAGVAEHIDFPEDHRQPAPDFDFEGYSDAVDKAREKFPGLRKGLEAGEPYLFREIFEEFIREKEIDFILGSVHMVDGLTPVYDSYFSAYDDLDKAYGDYFKEVKELVRYGNFDVAAHLNIVHRRGAEFNKSFTYEKFR